MRALLLAATAFALMACQTAPAPETSEGETEGQQAASLSTPAPPPVPGTVSVDRDGDHIYVDFIEFRPNRLPPGACLSEREIRADQFARLRSNMMVVGLTCRSIYEGNPFNSYMQFTVDTAGSIRSVQQTLAGLLGRYGGGNSNRLVDTYVTELANDEQGVIREFGPEVYCNARRDQFLAVTAYDDAAVSEWIDGAVARRGDLYPRC